MLWFLKEELAEEVLGDLDEKFYTTLNKNNLSKAKRNYWFQVINYMRPFAFKFLRSKLFNNTAMVKHNFKVSYRQLLRNKVYSVINIGGLAMGLTVAMLIGLWVQDELSFNKYHKNYNNIYQLLRVNTDPDGIYVNTSLTTAMGTYLKTNYPDMIESASMVRARPQDMVFAYGENKFRQIGLFVEPEIPEMLSLEMIRGTKDGLADLRGVLLSETFSKKLFGDENPMNKLVKLNAEADLIVKGIYRDIPNNSEFENAGYLARMELIVGPDNMNIWSNYNAYVYVQLKDNVNPEPLLSSINEAYLPNFNEYAIESQMKFIMHPMKDWHLRSEWTDGKPSTSQAMSFLWLYGIIGVFVLVLACINFMNLSTARSEKRAKEVGIRKTLGSLRKQLISQFYIESFLCSFLAFILSLGLLTALLPWFNETANKEILAPWSNTSFWILSISFLLLTAILSGSYPAIFLSRFKPIKALRGGLKVGKHASLPRKVLVVFQFTISIALIIATITVSNQIEMAKNLPMGYDTEDLLAISPASPDFVDKRHIIREEILKTGMVTAVGHSNYPVTNDRGWNPGFTWEGMDPTFTNSFNTISISSGYADAVGMKFIMGRNFDENLESDKRAIIINRSAMEAMNLENPVGMMVTYNPRWREARTYEIIGVVEDMIKNSPFERTYLSVMFQDEGYMSWMYIKLNPSVNKAEAIPAIEKVYSSILPEAPFDFTFAEDDYAKKFDAERRVSRLSQFFSILAVLISCLGLYGLTSYVAEQRTKEIGIRKVLGASVINLWKLLSKDFTFLVLIASVISIPLSYQVLDSWLDTYEIRTNLSWWIFTAGALGGLIITLITVSFQSIKAATANPVNSLRSE